MALCRIAVQQQYDRVRHLQRQCDHQCVEQVEGVLDVVPEAQPEQLDQHLQREHAREEVVADGLMRAADVRIVADVGRGVGGAEGVEDGLFGGSGRQGRRLGAAIMYGTMPFAGPRLAGDIALSTDRLCTCADVDGEPAGDLPALGHSCPAFRRTPWPVRRCWQR